MADKGKLPLFVAGQTPSLIEAIYANIIRKVVNGWLTPKVTPNGAGTFTIEENSAVLDLGPTTKRLTDAETRLTAIEGGTDTPGFVTPEDFNDYFAAALAGVTGTIVCNEDGTATLTFSFTPPPPEDDEEDEG